MYSQRSDLFEKLLKKTREVGRKLTSDEMNQDPEMPRANSYAFYYGSFDAAASEAWAKVKNGGSLAVQQRQGVIGMSKKVHRGRGHGLTTEEVLADLKALTERLGHVPSQAEIAKVENGAQFSYTTYLNKLGPKAEWPKVLGMASESEPITKPVEEAESEPVVAPVAEANQVAEPDVAPVAAPVTEACDDEWETIEIPAFSVKIPKALKGKMSITISLD